MSAHQRRKGQRGEREFCRALSEHLGETLTRQLGSERDGGPDVILDQWAIEIKRGQRIRLATGWQQTIRQGPNELGLFPALAYRANRQPWRVIVPLDVVMMGDLLWDPCQFADPLDGTATLSLAGFTTVIREFLRLKREQHPHA